MQHFLQHEEAEKEWHRFNWIAGSDRQVIINIEHLSVCHFLFEAFPVESKPRKLEDYESKYWVRVTLKDTKRRLTFFVDHEEPLYSPEDMDQEANYDRAPLQSILCDLEGGGLYAHERTHFIDDEGERVWIRVGDIAMLEVANAVFEPIELDEKDEAEAATAG